MLSQPVCRKAGRTTLLTKPEPLRPSAVGDGSLHHQPDRPTTGTPGVNSPPASLLLRYGTPCFPPNARPSHPGAHKNRVSLPCVDGRRVRFVGCRHISSLAAQVLCEDSLMSLLGGALKLLLR